MNNSEMPDINELLGKYYSTDDVSVKLKTKSAIISHMEVFVKHIAHMIARRADDPIEDLIQAGYIGVLRAIENFSQAKNSKFKTYATYYIIGEMRHFLRDKLNAIRVPAYVQDLIIRINSFTANMTQQELEELTSDEVALALNVPQKKVEWAMMVDRRKQTMSLDAMCDSTEGFGDYVDAISKNYKEKDSQIDNKIMLKEVFKQLTEDEQKVMDMFYIKDISQKDIATELGMSQMQVSRNLKHAYSHIQQYFDDKINDVGNSSGKAND